MAALARWKDLCLDAGRTQVALDFWSRVLDLEPELQKGGDGVLRGNPDERWLWINRVPEPKTVKNRVHLDLVRPDLAPLLALGAVVTMGPGPQGTGGPWSVLTDPEGNELCVFPPGEPTALVADSPDPVAIAGWWAGVLGADAGPAGVDRDGEPRWLREVDGLTYDVWKFVGVQDPKVVKNRMHWDVTCDDIPALVERGARVLRVPDEDVRWHVMADPDGNEFCAFASG